MKSRTQWLAGISWLLLCSSLAHAQGHRHHPLVDGEFDPGMEGPEYREVLERLEARGQLSILKSGTLQPILAFGKRNLEWLDVINRARPDGQKLELSTAATQVGYPIDSPSESNATLVLAKYNALRSEMPATLLAVLDSSAPLSAALPVDDATYLGFARRADRVYQQASRWLLEEPFLFQYVSQSRRDIRGYYSLAKEADLDRKLTDWNSLDVATRDRLTPWLIGQCRNQGNLPPQCTSEFTLSVQHEGNAKAFFQKYLGVAKRTYDSFFAIQGARTNLSWTATDPNVMHYPFESPASAEIQSWLKDNIEDEWRVGAWNLRLEFQPSHSSPASTTHVVFVAGATPHVNGLGGSEITMDANRNIQEYTSRWTIRHEFGHTMGFPDCYLEFYDEDREVMIQYQLDVDNLMCSRRGHLHQIHFDELKKSYFQN